MTESAKFYYPRQIIVRTYLWLIPLCLFLAVLGYVFHQRDSDSAIAMTAWGCALLGVYVLARSRSACIWVTAEGIFHPPFMKRRSYLWHEPVQVVPFSTSQGVFLMGDLDAPRNFRIPEFVMTDPAFRAALVRWAPPGYPLLAYLERAG